MRCTPSSSEILTPWDRMVMSPHMVKSPGPQSPSTRPRKPRRFRRSSLIRVTTSSARVCCPPVTAVIPRYGCLASVPSLLKDMASVRFRPKQSLTAPRLYHQRRRDLHLHVLEAPPDPPTTFHPPGLPTRDPGHAHRPMARGERTAGSIHGSSRGATGCKDGKGD